ncbi:MAG TPA: ABATE domain-containing protein [Longimicrobiales bacterium]
MGTADRVGRFKFVAGCLCLDFVNTVGGRVSGGETVDGRDFADTVLRDRLATYGDLVRWAVAAGVIRESDATAFERMAAARPDEAAAVLRRALRLRESLYRIFKAVIERWPAPDGDLAVLNGALRRKAVRERLVQEGAAFRLVADADPATPDRIVWAVVDSAVALLTSADRLSRVGQCPGDNCGWLFLDESRGRRRRWCDMAECGNLAKVRRHRARRRNAAGGLPGPVPSTSGARRSTEGHPPDR